MAKQKKPTGKVVSGGSLAVPTILLADVRNLIHQARETTAQAVNSALVLLYWQIGQRIRTEVLKKKRAEYGQQIVPTLSAQLVVDFGNGFSIRNIFRMLRFAETFPDREIVVTLSRQLGWSHFIEIIPDSVSRCLFCNGQFVP